MGKMVNHVIPNKCDRLKNKKSFVEDETGEENDSSDDLCSNASSTNQSGNEENATSQTKTHCEDEDMVFVPSDPAEWNSEHVSQWLNWTTKKFRLNPKPDCDKFPKTGVELCELTKSDFEKITGDQRSGELLAVHLAHLRHSATGHTSSSLNEKPKYKIDFEATVNTTGQVRLNNLMKIRPKHNGGRVYEYALFRLTLFN
ncbi:conserved hypothetical protein [Pediculus humanus corporis]|uniref:PNT domain-containing protein n=1 Tax=Pediculus humanus subsp. corporis TaxID=121224 RepID=E0VN06_PEDHC|nr:uncharacterized protein Phum_PHUM323610 [Pediculus humanus corporis]EEB14762.1 conserved hypothetical protein [Pediculus humanus corporis]